MVSGIPRLVGLMGVDGAVLWSMYIEASGVIGYYSIMELCCDQCCISSEEFEVSEVIGQWTAEFRMGK